MRIKVILPVPVRPEGRTGPIGDLIRARLKVAAPTTDLQFVAPADGPTALSTLSDRFLSGLILWPAAEVAGAEGFDAVVVDCTCDQLSDASGSLGLPLISPLQATLPIAGLMADRWAIVTPNKGQASIYWHLVHRYGYASRVTSVRETDVPTGYGSEEEFAAIADESAHAIKSEGAQLIVLGCTAFTAEDRLSEVLGVAVLAPGSVAIKTAEMMVDLALHRFPRPNDGAKSVRAHGDHEFDVITVADDGHVVAIRG